MNTETTVSVAPRSRGLGIALLLLGVVCAVALLSFWEVRRTRPQRAAVGAYYRLLAAANRQELAAARGLCTPAYLQRHRLEPAPEGGLAGLPRGIHHNFQVWREGANVWICPTDRTGPVYQFVESGGAWLFDGPIGLLQADGTVVPGVPDAAGGPEATLP